jgi:hypothetical protein
MVHELWCVSGSTMTNITPLVGSISWRSNINELGEQLDFDIAFNDARYFPKSPVDIGSLIILKNENKEVNRTIVVKENIPGRSPRTYNCFDFAFYLNKSKDTYQFNKTNSSTAINEVLKRAGIAVGRVSIPNISVTQIYQDKAHSEVLKDILDLIEKETGVKCRMEMRLNKIYIEKQKDLIINPKFKLASNIAPGLCVDAISNLNRSRSIEEMKNSIKIISTDDKKVQVITSVKNDNLIKQYGLLQEVVNVNKEDLAQAKNIANNMLKGLGKVFEENSITVPGNDEIRAGRILEIEEPITGMKGKYLIESAQHTVRNGIHMCNVGLGVI